MKRLILCVLALTFSSFVFAQSTQWEYARLDWNSEIDFYNIALPDESFIAQTPEELYQQLTGTAPATEGTTGTFAMMNAMGAEGWELINSVEEAGGMTQYIFKRTVE